MSFRLPFQCAHQPPRRRQTQLARQLTTIRQYADSLQQLDDAQLISVTEQLRETLSGANEFSDADVVEAFGLSVEAIRRTLGVTLYDVQIQAALALARGHVAELQTGEGKTLAAVPAAMVHALTGCGVHVVTTNAYLAGRDFCQLQPAYEALGLTVGWLPEQATADDKRNAYQCDITYGTGYEFGFDYLRDQVARRGKSDDGLGKSILSPLRGGRDRVSDTVQRGHAFAIVDEVDNVLIDDAGSPLVLSDNPDAKAVDADAHRLAKALIELLEPEHHFRVSAASGLVEITPRGRERIHGGDVPIPVQQLRRAWTEYVEQALRARFLFRRDVHYIVQNETVRIVDSSTGRIFADRTWRDGLHQAIEAKENLTITAEKNVLAQVTRQRYFRLYDRLAGMTGTAVGCDREFQTVYGLAVTPIPLRVPCRRIVLPLRSFVHRDAKWEAIVRDIAAIHRAGRPILVGTRSIEDSERLADGLRTRGLPFQLLNGCQDQEEAQVIAEAGKKGAITLSTNMAGRGTDIRLADNVPELGGLHVIVAEPHDSSRVDRQLIGRCARQGDPGSAQAYLACDDALIQRYGAWLSQPMTASANRSGEIGTDLTSRIRRIQQSAERAQYASRSALLRRDLTRDSLMARFERQP